jgi:four helix bundle protein
MNAEEMKRRTRCFALSVIRLVRAMPKGQESQVLGRQLLRAGTSVGANYRAACRGKSPADFIAKMGIVEEEADETMYWMELLMEAGLLRSEDAGDLMKEADEIVAITVASIRTARGKS